MEQVFIRKTDLNKWIAKYFPNQDLISIEELLAIIEELDSEVDRLKEKISDLENQEEPIKDYYDYYGVSRNDFI